MENSISVEVINTRGDIYNICSNMLDYISDGLDMIDRFENSLRESKLNIAIET